MKNVILFLQAIVVLIGIAVLFFLLRFPMMEGRAQNLDLFRIYSDPFILYGYAMSIPFFMALYQLFKLLGLIRQQQTFSAPSAAALQKIRYCAIALIVLIVGAAVYISLAHHPDDDPAGFLAVSIVATLLAVLVAIVAARFEKMVQMALDRRA